MATCSQWCHVHSGVKLGELVKGDTVHVRNHRGGQEKWIPGKIIRRLGPLTYLVQVRVQRPYVQVDHLRLTAESDSYRSVSENTVPMIPNVLGSVSVPSPLSDQSVCQPVSVPQNTEKEPDPSVREQQDTTVVSSTPLSIPVVIRRSGRRTKKRDILDL